MSTTETIPSNPPVMPEESAEVDYFGFQNTETVYLPGSKTQFVVIKALNEGEKKRYQNLTNKDVTLTKGGETKMRLAAGDERHALLTESIVDWRLVRRNDKGEMVDVRFSRAEVGRFLTDVDPKVIEHVEKAVRKLNPWTLADMSVEDIDREIANLQEMRDVKVKEEAGNFGS